MNWTRDLEEILEKLPSHHKNIRTLKALENLLNNLDKIKVEDIEALTFVPVIETPIYHYDVLIDFSRNKKGWIAIEDNMIPDISKIPEYIKKGILRKHSPLRNKVIGTASKTSIENEFNDI